MLYNSDSDDSIEPLEGSAVHKKRARIAAQRRRMEELGKERRRGAQDEGRGARRTKTNTVLTS